MRRALLLVVALAGCTGKSGSSVDGGSSGEAGAPSGPNIPWWSPETGEVSLPIAPSALEPCPTGWRVDPSRTPVACDPWPASGRAECPVGQAHFPGDPGCTPIGSACPAGDFADGLPTDGSVIFVRRGAAGGDGSAAAPFGTIAEALAATASGEIIALAKGTYDEAITVPAGATIWGACAAQTLITASASSSPALITVASVGGRIRDVRVGGGALAGVLVRGLASVDLDGVLVDDAAGFGIALSDGSRVQAREVVVRATRAGVDGTLGYGVGVSARAQLTLARALLERNHSLGVAVGGEGATARLEDVAIEGTLSQPRDHRFGIGLTVDTASTVDASRIVVEGNRVAGIAVQSSGTSFTATDVIVRDTEADEADGTAGTGLYVLLGATVQIARSLFERNRSVGVLIDGSGTSVRLDDTIVRETRSQASGSTHGIGVSAQGGASVEIVRGTLDANRFLGLNVIAETRIALEDVVVRGTQSEEATGGVGRAIALELGAYGTMKRVLVEGNRDTGIFVIEGSTLDLEDVVVRDTESERSSGLFGRALGAQSGARVTGRRIVLQSSRDLGIYAESASVSLEDLVVLDSRSRACDVTSCAEYPGGIGVGSYYGSAVALTRFGIRGAPLCGVHVALAGELDLSGGYVREAAIGACIQIDGYDLARLTSNVSYDDNGTNLQATMLPVPEPAESVGL